MRIGIDVREFKTGIYTGLRTILNDILAYLPLLPGDEIILFGNQFTDFEDIPLSAGSVVINEKNTFIWDQIRLPFALRKEKVDVFFSPYIKTPLWRVCPYINTICDTIPLKISKYKGVMAVLEKTYFYAYAMISGHRASKVITLSEHAKSDVNKVFGIEKDKIEVVYPSVDITRYQKQGVIHDKNNVIDPAEGSPYMLYVGNFKRHKNVKQLIEGYECLPDKIKAEYKLVLAGASKKEKDIIEDYISDKGLNKNVVAISNISHADVLSVIKRASVFVFPSLAEGFGIPPVEAMASGVPVASSSMEPMKEVLGEAAVFFDPYDPDDIARAVRSILENNDARDEYIRKGYERASIFSAKRLSERVMEVIRYAGEKKTICISSEFPPVIGGISSQVYNLWKRFDREKILILTSDPEDKDRSFDTGLNVIRKRYPLGSTLLLRLIRTFAVISNVRKYNKIFHIRYNHCAQVMSSGVAGILMKMTKGVPYLIYVYSADILEFSRNPIAGFLMKRILSESDKIIANSRFTKDIIVEKRLADEAKIVVLTPGIDTSLFFPEAGCGDIRSEYNIPPDKKILLTVARLAERKGHTNVIRAVAEILQNNPDVIYIIVGDGPERPGIEEEIKYSGLDGSVIITGDVPLDKLVHFYNLCDIFVMAPRYIEAKGDVEGFGIVFLEAGACGKPVVAGRSGGVAEAVIDGETGILVDSEDSGNIRDAVLELIQDPEKAGRYGSNALERVRKEFSWDDRASVLSEFI